MARPALLYFLLWLGVILSSAMDLEKRIIGGQPCNETERLYHVRLIASPPYLVRKVYRPIICGGSLIRDQWVLTAAHCVPEHWSVNIVINVHPGRDAKEVIILPDDIYIHKQQNSHDIMLLELQNKHEHIQTIDIPDADECKNDLKEGDIFQVAGQGFNTIDNQNKSVEEYPNKLLCLNDVPVVECGPFAERRIKGSVPLLWLSEAFCAQAKGKDIAKGDSGGGVEFKGKIYGVNISGHPDTAFVEPFHFLRVCPFLHFIKDTIQNKEAMEILAPQ